MVALLFGAQLVRRAAAACRYPEIGDRGRRLGCGLTQPRSWFGAEQQRGRREPSNCARHAVGRSDARIHACHRGGGCVGERRAFDLRASERPRIPPYRFGTNAHIVHQNSTRPRFRAEMRHVPPPSDPAAGQHTAHRRGSSDHTRGGPRSSGSALLATRDHVGPASGARDRHAAAREFAGFVRRAARGEFAGFVRPP